MVMAFLAGMWLGATGMWLAWGLGIRMEERRRRTMGG